MIPLHRFLKALCIAMSPCLLVNSSIVTAQTVAPRAAEDATAKVHEIEDRIIFVEQRAEALSRALPDHTRTLEEERRLHAARRVILLGEIETIPKRLATIKDQIENHRARREGFAAQKEYERRMGNEERLLEWQNRIEAIDSRITSLEAEALSLNDRLQTVRTELEATNPEPESQVIPSDPLLLELQPVYQEGVRFTTEKYRIIENSFLERFNATRVSQQYSFVTHLRPLHLSPRLSTAGRDDRSIEDLCGFYKLITLLEHTSNQSLSELLASPSLIENQEGSSPIADLKLAGEVYYYCGKNQADYQRSATLLGLATSDGSSHSPDDGFLPLLAHALYLAGDTEQAAVALGYVQGDDPLLLNRLADALLNSTESVNLTVLKEVYQQAAEQYQARLDDTAALDFLIASNNAAAISSDPPNTADLVINLAQLDAIDTVTVPEIVAGAIELNSLIMLRHLAIKQNQEPVDRFSALRSLDKRYLALLTLQPDPQRCVLDHSCELLPIVVMR
jgi:hypothetical protein